MPLISFIEPPWGHLCQTRDGGDNVLRRDMVEGELNVTTGQKLIYMPDQLGSVRDVLDATTGSLVAAYDYAPYGSNDRSYGSTPTDYRFAGLLYHAASGLNLGTYRALDGATGRFINRDPIGLLGGINFYDYTRSNPTNLIDPLGLCADKKDTADCILNALQSLFPGATVSVGDSTGEVGGHWNFNVQLQFSSYDAANAFYSAYTGSATDGWPPPARFDSGPSLHLENLGNWSVNGGTYSIAGTAHIDLYNPNGSSVGGGGLRGKIGHVSVDFIGGHLVQALGGNIDLANCPW